MSAGPQAGPGVPVPFGATVTILFSDIRGFTEYTEQYGDEAAFRVLRQHNALVRSQIENFGGRVVKTQGDSFMVYFTTARASILCAIAVQRAIAEATHEEPGTHMALGIGINTGEPIQEGGDFFGSTVNLAARICAAAGPGQVLISETTRYVAGRIDGVEYVDHGLRELKGFQEPQRLFEVSWVPPDARGAGRGQSGRDLRRELVALSERFARLGTALVEASNAMRAGGSPPPDPLVRQAAALRAAFVDLRARACRRAAALEIALPPTTERAAAIGELERIVADIEAAETSREPAGAGEERPSREGLETAVQRAIGVLNRVLVVMHRDDPAFQPLIECQARAGELRLRLSRAMSQDSDLTAPRVDEAMAPFAALLALVVGRDSLDDEQFARAEDMVTRVFGRQLAIAATRGRLGVQGEEPRAARPAQAAAVAPAPQPRQRPEAEERPVPAPAEPAPAAAASLPPTDPRGALVPWWAAASEAWRSWKSSGMATAHALRAAFAKHPHLLAVPIRTSADQGDLAAGYFLLLEHVENVSPAFIRTALDRAAEAAGGAGDGHALEGALYRLMVDRGRLRDTFADFVRDVMIAAIPTPGVWLDGGVVENEEDTVVVRRDPQAPGAGDEREERLTEQKDRVAEHRFAAVLAPLTARFFFLRRGDVKESRDVEVKVASGGEPTDAAWLLMLRSDHMLHAPPRRVTPPTTALPGFGKNYSGLWIGAFNPDPERDRQVEVCMSVRPEVSVAATRRSVFGARPR